MNREEIIQNLLINAGRGIKEMLGAEVEINFESEKERVSGTTDKNPDIHFKLEIILKQK